jgi:hypothetical protein
MRFTACLACLAALSFACAGSTPTAPGAQPPVLQQIQPSALAVGDSAIVTGVGFTGSANALRIGAGYLTSLSSSDGTSLRFVLPTSLSACPPRAQVCVALAVLLTPGTYTVSVVNDNGTSNEATLQVVAR